MRGQTALPADLGDGPRGEELSRATRAQVRGPAGLTCCPGRFALGSVVPWCRPALPHGSRPAPRPRGVDQLSRVTRASVRGSTMSAIVLGESSCGPRSRRFDQMTRASLARVRRPRVSSNTPGRLGLMSKGPQSRPSVLGDWAQVRWSAQSTSCPGGLAPSSDRPRVRQALPGDMGSGPMARGVDQVSRRTRTML